MSMFKKFLHGLMFGCGFSVALIAVLWTYFGFMSEKRTGEIENTVSEVPIVLEQQEQFYGSSARYSGGLSGDRNKVLSEGDAEIIGSIFAEDRPVAGVKLRLWLNGGVMSQWGVTDVNGQYQISAPAGEYKVDGYELDFEVANTVLSGLIDSPQNDLL